jgi:uncharacterized membrane protein (UPF0127 family)
MFPWLQAGPLILAAAASLGSSQFSERLGEIVLPDETRVRVQIADTEPRRQRGLMRRKSLGEHEGMIFVFAAPGYYPFWMKDTLIPLDIIWLQQDGRIVSIAADVPPCRADPCPEYPPAAGTTAVYVLEVNAGFAKKHALKVGDVLLLRGIPQPAAARQW